MQLRLGFIRLGRLIKKKRRIIPNRPKPDYGTHFEPLRFTDHTARVYRGATAVTVLPTARGTVSAAAGGGGGP